VVIGAFCFAFMATFFLMLVHKKEGKEQDTPASAFSLRYSVCRAAIKNSLLWSSNSCLPKTPANPALLGAADGDPEHQASATINALNKPICFFNRSNCYAVSLARSIPFHHAE
jgi:hypothetical protein